MRISGVGRQVAALVACVVAAACSGNEGTPADVADGRGGDTETRAGDSAGLETDAQALDVSGEADVTQVEPIPDVGAELEVVPDEAGVELPLEEVEVAADVAEDEVGAFVCDTPESCEAEFGAQPQCLEWSCVEGECLAVPVEAGVLCDDGEVCTETDKCNGEGKCTGVLIDCDDYNICTDDSCFPGSGCVHNPVPPEACVDSEGNPGVKECADNAWGECVAGSVCDLKVNTNDTGTVNPYIFPAREGNFYISYVASEDGGGNVKLAWADPDTCFIIKGPFTVNQTPGGAYYWGAQSAVSDDMGNFYAVWEADGKLGEIHFSYSETGIDFKPPIEVVSVSDNGLYPSMAILQPGQPIITWVGYMVVPQFPKGFSYDPMVAMNPNAFGGGTFTQAVHVAATEVQDDQTAIALDNSGNIFIAWQSFPDGTDQGGNIYVAKSSDGGTTFSDPVRVNDVQTKANAGISNFMVWGEGRLYLVWWDYRNDPEGDVYLDSSSDGATFGSDVLVNDSTYRYQEDPTVAVGTGTGCKGTVYVVWQDLRSNKSYDIYGAKSIDQGKTFLPNEMMNPSVAGDQMNPALAIDHSCVAGVSWRDSSGNSKFDVHATFRKMW